MKEEIKIDYSAKYFRAAQAAKYLGISLPTFYRRISDGHMKPGAHQSARCVLWKREDLDAYIERTSVQ